MSLIKTAHLSQDKAAGIAASLLLHAIVLCCLWNYHINYPTSEARIIFVNYVDSAPPTKTELPVVPKPVKAPPLNQRAPQTQSPVASPQPNGPAPITAPAETVVSKTSVSKEFPAPVPMSTPIATPTVSHSASVVATHTAETAAVQPVQLYEELSVSCTERPAPAYPRLSVRLNEQGKTVLLVELDEFGKVTAATVKTTSGFPRLDEAAINAVKTWHCSPARRNGVPVRSVAQQPFNFILKGRSS